MRKINKIPEVEVNGPGMGTVRYVEHGCPCEQIRWHVHDEYELHLIVATTGKVFVGDYIGLFAPGQLILTGPRLPHNWISDKGPQSHVALRDMALQFNHETFAEGMRVVSELGQLLPLLERAKFGIEFTGIDLEKIRKRFETIRDTSGFTRIVHVFDLLNALSNWRSYRLLSTLRIHTNTSETLQRKINTVVEYVINGFEMPISLREAADLVGMTESHFSRFFRKATGNRFVEFVNRVRVSKACELLAETEDKVANICFRVGFNNVANFNRRFQEFKGVTPRQYRRQTTQCFSAGARISMAG